MYKLFKTGVFVVLLFVETVMSHGGHNDGPLTNDALQDALVSFRCRGVNGYPCNGHGSCSSGMCTCYRGYSGQKCEINDADITSFGLDGDTFGSDNTSGFSLHDLIPHHHHGDTTGRDNNMGGFDLHDLIPHNTEPPQILACITNDENTCSGHGFCLDGSCVCESGHSGVMCELSSKVGFCRSYKECAECTALMIDCPKKCSLMATFKLVFGFPIVTAGATFRKCRFRNSGQNCTFYFKQESESSQGMKTIAVKACMYYHEATTNASDTVEQRKDKPLQPVTSSKPTTSSQPTTSSPDDQSNTGIDSHDHSHDHEHGTMGDTEKQNNNQGDSGTSFIKPEMLLVVGGILMLLQL